MSSGPGALAEAVFMVRAEAAEMVLSVRALFLVLVYAVLAGGAGWATLKLNEKLDGKLADLTGQLDKIGDAERTQLLQQVADNGLPTAVAEAYLDGSLPLILLIILWSSTFVLPGLMLVVGFNRISGDTSTRFTRYVLQRVHRGSYLTGKIVGHWLVSFLAVLVAHGILLAVGASTEVFDFDRITEAMPRIWLGMALFTFAYSAYTQLFSILFSQPFLSLLFGVMAIMGMKFTTFVLSFFYPPLGQVWLGDWDMRLWALDPAALAVFAAYGVGFVALSFVVLRRKDL